MAAKEKDSLYEGDGILIFCGKAEGFVFSPPPLSTNVTSVSIHSVVRGDSSVPVTYPGFSNVHYASFKIHPRKKDRGVSDKTNKELVFGRKVYLYHVASKWYLSFIVGDSSKTANLVESKKDASVFRIISSDPNKTTGQPIKAEDVVRLEIIGGQGERSQVLCVPNKLSFNGYELRKGSDGSDFTLYSQSTELKQGPPLALRGGEVVMFLNEKRDSFITVVEDKRVMAKVADGPNRSSIFTGGDSYWQIENAAIQYDGNWVDLGNPWTIRIKHLPSKCYLALVTATSASQSKFMLIEDGNDEDCIFNFEEDHLEPDSGLYKRRYALLKHKDAYVTLDGSNSELINNSRCFNIIPKPSTEAISDRRDQKFWIEEVDEEVLSKFAKLSGAFITLKAYLEKMETGATGEVVVALPMDTLEALADWTGKEESNKGTREKWPDMLRAMEGVDLVLQFLKRESTSESTKMIQKELCTVLKNYINFASDESQLYLISKEELLSSLYSLMGCDVGAEDVLSALIRCRSFGSSEKMKVLEEVFKPDTILDELLFKKQDFEFLKCLSALCMSGGKSEKKIQCDLVDKIIIPGHEKGIFFKISCREDANKIARLNIELPVMFRDASFNHTMEKHLINQILFYAAICEGVNLPCIERMTVTDAILTYDAVNLCLEYYNKYPAVQSAFFRYLVTSMVDKNAEESGTDLENIWNIYAWKRFNGSETKDKKSEDAAKGDDKEDSSSFNAVKLAGLANTLDVISDKEQMVKMQKQIQESLERDENWKKDIEEGRIELMTQKLCVLETLVAYGFYWMPEVGDNLTVPSPHDVIEALIKILGYKPTNGVKASRRHQEMCKLQAKAIQVLNLFLHQTYHLGTSRILFDYGHFSSNNAHSAVENYHIPKDHFSKLTNKDFNVDSMLPDHIHLDTIRDRLVTQKITEANDRLRWILYEEKAGAAELNLPSQFQPAREHYDYECLNVYDQRSNELKRLLIGFMADIDAELRLSAAKLFFELYQGEKHLFHKAKQSLIVSDTCPGSWEVYTTMVKFATYQDKVKEVFIRTLLRLSQGKAVDSEIKPSVIKFCNDVIAISGSPPNVTGLSPRDETFTEKRGQDIVVTTGVFTVLLNYVVKYSTSFGDSAQSDVINKVCETLLTIVRNNDDTKQVVFARFDDLLQSEQGMGSIAHLLTEVLTDNIEFCRRLPLQTVRNMFRMAAIKDNCNKEYYEFIPVLEAWIKVGKNYPHLLKKHQRFVASLFEQFFKDFYESDWDPEKSPIQKLEEEDNDKFVLLTHLLATCTEGIHKYSEDIARSVFDFSTLIRIVSMESIPYEKRLPFLILLNEAFLKTERESLLSVMDVARNKAIWAHVELMCYWLEAMDQRLAKVKDNKKTVSCQAIKVKVIFAQHMTHTYWKKHRVYKVNVNKPPFKEEQISIDTSDGSQTQPLGILYQYLIEGLVPMLSAFAEEFKSLWSTYKDKIGSERKPLLETDKNLLVQFGNKMKDIVTKYHTIFVTTDRQKEYWGYHLGNILDIDSDATTIHREGWLEMELEELAAKKLSEEKDKGPSEEEDKELSEEEDKEPSEEEKEDNVNENFKIYLNNFRSMIHYQTDSDSASLFPKGPGFSHLVEFIVKDNEQELPLSHKIGHLVELIMILHKDIQLCYDSKRKEALSELTITVLQVLSNILHCEVPDEDYDSEEMVEDKYEKLKEKQTIYLQQNTLQRNTCETCMLLLNHENNDEICLQVFGLLTVITLNANIEAQDKVFECVSDRDSAFCRRMFLMLKNVSTIFRETWANVEVEKTSSEEVNEPKEMKKRGQKETTFITETVYGGTLGLESLDDSIRTAGILLDCISALCDGQHKKMQRFLLDQDQSFKKLDIIKCIAILLDILTEEYEKTLKRSTETAHESTETAQKRVFCYLDLIQKAIQALIETVAGNFKNQEAVFQCQITDTINYLLGNLRNEKIISKDKWSEEKQTEIKEKKRTLNKKAIELLQILLEETDERSTALIANFTEDVELDVIVESMFYWEEIEAYHILRLVATCKDISVDKLMFKRMKLWLRPQHDLWKDFKARSRCIEVIYEPDKQENKKILTKVYFDYDPLYELPEDAKDTITNAISEEAQERNLTEFNEWGRAIRRNANYQYKFFQNTNKWFWLFVYRILFETSSPRHLLLVFLTVLLNILTLAVFVVPRDHTYNATGEVPNWIVYPGVPVWYFPYLQPILGIIHMCLSFWMYAEFLVREWPNFTTQMFFVTIAQNMWQSFKRWVSHQEVFKSRCPKGWRLKQKHREVTLTNSVKQTDDLDDIIDDPNYEEPYYYEDEDDADGYFTMDIIGFQSIYRLVFLICSIIAIPLRGYTYCICLFYVFLQVDVVQYILTALTRARKQLCFVFFISAGVLLLFAMAAFVFLHDYFEPSTPLYCSNLWECYISVTREGLLDTLGLAIPFTISAQGDDAIPSYRHYALRALFFDLPFFIVVTTIILNIVTAVLIDRFSDLREERDQVESNKAKACFICGRETEEFERNGKGFRNHVKEDHNKWNYLYYLIYLDRKNRNDLSALEKQVADNNKIDKKYGKTDHYPINCAKVLPDKKDSD